MANLPNLRAGDLVHTVRVDFVSTATTGNTYGEAAPSWSTTDSGSLRRQARIESPWQTRNGMERMVADQAIGDATHLVTMRHLSSLSVCNSRLRFSSRVFDINAIDNLDNRNVYDRVWCKEKVQ